MTPSPMTRRRALAGGAAGLSVPVLAACGADDAPSTTSTEPNPTGSSAPSDGVPTGEPPAPSESTDDGSAAGTSNRLAAVDDVPVGSGVIPAGAAVVVTQPRAGEFRGFDATCTHQGCLVSTVTETINCTCHASAFDLATGAPVSGPAPTPLAPVAVRVRGGEVVRA